MCGRLVTACPFVGEDQSQEVLVGHLALPRQHEPLWKRVDHLAQLQATKNGAQLARDSNDI